MIEAKLGLETDILVAMVLADGSIDTGSITEVKILDKTGSFLTGGVDVTMPSETNYGGGLSRLRLTSEHLPAVGRYFVAVKTATVGSVWRTLDIMCVYDFSYMHLDYVSSLVDNTNDLANDLVEAMRGSRVLRKDITEGWVLDVYYPGAVVGVDQPMLTKILRDKNGDAITDPAVGAVAQELEIVQAG
ncbi:MAG: hypothetical protein AB7I29_14690 [Geobacter sp.]